MKLDEQMRLLLEPLLVEASVWSAYTENHVVSAQSLFDADIAPAMMFEDLRAARFAAALVASKLAEVEAVWAAHNPSEEEASDEV